MTIDELEKILGRRPRRPAFGFSRHRARVEYLVSMWTWEEDARILVSKRAEEKTAALKAVYESTQIKSGMAYASSEQQDKYELGQNRKLRSALADFFDGAI